MNNIFFKTLFKKGAKGAKGERGINYEVPQNAIIGFDDEDGELDIPAGYDDATIPPYLVEKTIRANGTYSPTYDGAFGYSDVTVDVGGAPVLVPKTITANGTYNPAADNADGYSSVIVNVGADGTFYSYTTAFNGQIVVRRKLTISGDTWTFETKWFFNGFDFGENADVAIPNNLLSLLPSGDISGETYDDNTSQTQEGWIAIGVSLGNIFRHYTTSWALNYGGVVWAVLDNESGLNQTLPWSDPYDV